MGSKEKIRNLIFSFGSLFLILFLFFLMVFDPTLYYHQYQPIFLFDKTYLKEFLLYPGGLAELIAQFFFQFFYFKFFGAFFIAAISLSIFIIIHKLIKKINNLPFSLLLSFLPFSLFLIMQNRYNFPLILLLKYFLALLFLLLYVNIPERYKVLFILLSFSIYYILGGWIYLFFILLSTSNELLFSKNKGKYIYTVLNILVYLLYPFIATRYLFMITLKEAYFYIVPFRFYSWPILFNMDLYSYLFFFSLPLLQIGLFFYLKYGKARFKEKKQNNFLVSIHTLSTQTILIMLASALILTFSFNSEEKRVIQIDYLAEKERWDELLKISRKIKEYNILVNFNVNRALYHKGEMLEALFDYPQMKGASALFLENTPRDVVSFTSDLYFDLGHIKGALVAAYEGLTKFGYNPRILKRIVMAHIICGRYVVAKKFLDLLNKSIPHKKWVRYYNNYLFNEDIVKSDSLIQSKRKLLPKFDFFIAIGQRIDEDLTELLKENENNKIAFEYLMAYYLLEFRLEDLVKYLDKFKKLGYEKYPKHIEEALLLFKFMFPSKDIKFDYSIDEETLQQFERFNGILASFENKEKAKETLKKRFYNTYWYYVLYIKP